MNKEEILKNAQDRVDTARIVESTIKSKGWAVFKEMLDTKIEDLSSVFNCNNAIDLEANKKAVLMIQSLLEEFEALTNVGDTQDIVQRLSEE